jgi:hypothetical protein
MRHRDVPLRDYVDRALADLTRYHDRDTASLQAEIDRRLGEAQRETESRFREQAAAALAATSALDKRLDAMNEFRESIRDTTARKIDTDLYRQTVDSLTARMEAIEATQDRQRGRIAVYSAAGSILIVVVAILTLILNHVQF